MSLHNMEDGNGEDNQLDGKRGEIKWMIVRRSGVRKRNWMCKQWSCILEILRSTKRKERKLKVQGKLKTWEDSLIKPDESELKSNRDNCQR